MDRDTLMAKTGLTFSQPDADGRYTLDAPYRGSIALKPCEDGGWTAQAEIKTESYTATVTVSGDDPSDALGRLQDELDALTDQVGELAEALSD